ncbi:M42 family metallopeptidase [Anaeromicropila herbilytica]|uniref:Glutamyl aminopeptidase n=1 Tax=Anaeromicropila herbilytica TaxID=2785025 RepID=A0A7R7EM17_9FIRM|nr:M42 family metallopeptidase [Anaeromicropila herbilytica]BCN31228.1 glutamyl aminopeptidase [Anaeromicropila herbilytica]
MKIENYRDYILNTMKDFIEVPSPVSYYEEILPLLEKYAINLGYDVTYDRKRTGYITLEGEDNSKTICVGAHLDTLGLIIKTINSDGSISVTQLGGINYSSIEGETVTVHTREGKKYTGLMTCISHSVHVFDDARTLQRDENSMVIMLDKNVTSEDEVIALGIEAGDIVSINPRFEYTEDGYIKSRFIDDKAAVASVFTALKYMKDNGIKPKYRTLLAFPFYEEIGHGGAYIPSEVEEYVAIDIGLIGPELNGSEYQVSICAKDNYSPYDRGLTTKLIQLAKENEVDYVVDVFYRYGTDANAAVRAGNNVYAAAFGMAVHSSHGVERTNIKAIEETIKLLIVYLTSK